MAQIDGLRRYLDAALALGQITRARAEDSVRELIQAGELESNRAQEWVENLVTSSRDRYDAVVSTVRTEVRAQLKEVGITNVDELARRVANILEKGQAAARKAAKRPGGRVKKTAAKKSASKRAPAKKAAGKKEPAKRAPAKRAPAKRTTTKTAAKKTAKRAPAKKSPAKKTAYQ